jgi:hypothetical protein
MTDGRVVWTPEAIKETSTKIEDMARYACSQYMIAKILGYEVSFFDDNDWARTAWQAGHQDFARDVRTNLVSISQTSDDDHARIKALEKLFRWFSDKPMGRTLCGGNTKKTLLDRYESLMNNYDAGVITDEALINISKALKDYCEVLKLQKVDEMEADLKAIKEALKLNK